MTLVELSAVQARYLSMLAAQDIRRDRARGLDRIADRHAPAWEALQAACGWPGGEEEDGWRPEPS